MARSLRSARTCAICRRGAACEADLGGGDGDAGDDAMMLVCLVGMRCSSWFPVG